MNEDTKTNEQELLNQRKEKLRKLKEDGIAYPNKFQADASSADLRERYGDEDADVLSEKNICHTMCGRIILRRMMGKAAFITLRDASGSFQVYVRKDTLGEQKYEMFSQWDLGDIVWVSGKVFRTKTNELTIEAQDVSMLTKSLRPPPDKHKGLTNIEIRYRQRYLDLMTNPNVAQLFYMRSQIISHIRGFFEKKGFQEVETPMLHNLPGGANAKPFETYHNAADVPLFLRIAPELHLKRLLVGGFEKVFEINRNFRNEGVSSRHNPEFTMLEFYQAYADYSLAMTMTEKLVHELVVAFVNEEGLLNYQGTSIHCTPPYEKITHSNVILKYNPSLTEKDLKSADALREYMKTSDIRYEDNAGLGSLQNEIFEKTVERKLIQPCFVIEYPAEISPLARRNDENKHIADRFEFFIAGTEIANGFSELNDPQEQAFILKKQAETKKQGNDEAMYYDQDYITALEYGMPPAVGEGIGIDRLVMLLTDSPSIRDVVLFPQLRQTKESKAGEN